MWERYKGSTLSIVDSNEGTTKYRGKIVDVGQGGVLTLDPPVGRRIIRVVGPASGGRVYRKEHGSPEQWKADVVCIEDWMSGNFVIRNNVVRHGHRFGVILPSQYGLVEGNVFEDVSASAICVLNRMNEWPQWIKYHARGGMIIRGNTIRDCNTSLTYRDQNAEGAIHVAFHNRFFQDSRSAEIKDILIEGNTIHNWRQTGIHVSSSRNVVIRNNRLVVTDPTLPLDPPGKHNLDMVHAGIVVRNSSGVLVENNLIVDPRPIVGAVHVDKDSVADARLSNNRLVGPKSRE